MKQKICIGILTILLIIFMVLTFYYRNKYVKFEASAYEGNKNLYQELKKQKDAGIVVEEVSEDDKSWYRVYFKNYYLDGEDGVITVHDDLDDWENHWNNSGSTENNNE